MSHAPEPHRHSWEPTIHSRTVEVLIRDSNGLLIPAEHGAPLRGDVECLLMSCRCGVAEWVPIREAGTMTHER